MQKLFIERDEALTKLQDFMQKPKKKWIEETFALKKEVEEAREIIKNLKTRHSPLTEDALRKAQALEKEVEQLQAKSAIGVKVRARFHALVADGEPDATGAALQALSDIMQAAKKQRRE